MLGDKRAHRYYSLLPQLLKHPTPDNRRAIQQLHSHLTTNASLSPQTLTTALWNTILRHYSLGPFPHQAILLFKHLQLHHPHRHRHRPRPVSFESFAYSFLIKACANMEKPVIGMQFHGLSLKAGFEFEVYVQTALVNMYVVCGSVVEAKKVFDEMPEKIFVTWNALITGVMKLGELDLARGLFEVMPEKNVVSWTGLVDGYVRMNRLEEALWLFRRMVVDEGIRPTEITILAIMPALWKLRALELCESVHGYGERSGFNASDIRVVNSLIDAYAKCGCVASALKVFEELSAERRNLVSWTTIISGLAMHGMAEEAVDCFRRMETACVKPNSVTFLSVLNACSHGGLVEQGLAFFRKMVTECQLVPNIKHYGCLIDMLGRAGRLEDAEKMALEIPPEMANVIIWRTLLGACSVHGNVEMGERVTRKVLEMETGYGGDYALLSNIFVGAGRFADSERTRRVMDERNAPKVPGLSLV